MATSTEWGDDAASEDVTRGCGEDVAGEGAEDDGGSGEENTESGAEHTAKEEGSAQAEGGSAEENNNSADENSESADEEGGSSDSEEEKVKSGGEESDSGEEGGNIGNSEGDTGEEEDGDEEDADSEEEEGEGGEGGEKEGERGEESDNSGEEEAASSEDDGGSGDEDSVSGEEEKSDSASEEPRGEKQAAKTDYEALRDRNVARNTKRITDLGIPSLAGELKEAITQKGSTRAQKERAAGPINAAPPQRQSSRRRRCPSLYVSQALRLESSPFPRNNVLKSCMSMCPSMVEQLGVPHCTPVEEVLKVVANMADAQVEQVFQGISLMPQISSSVLGRMSELYTDLFQHSRDLSSEEELRPTRRSNRIKAQTATVGRRQSRRKKAVEAIKQGGKGKQSDSDSDYVAGKEEDNSGSGDQEDSSGDLEEVPGAEEGLKEAAKSKSTASKKVSPQKDIEQIF